MVIHVEGGQLLLIKDKIKNMSSKITKSYWIVYLKPFAAFVICLASAFSTTCTSVVGMVSNKMSIRTIFGHKHFKSKNFISILGLLELNN